MHAYTELTLRVVGEKFRARGLNALAWSELGPGALTRLGPGSLTTLGPAVYHARPTTLGPGALTTLGPSAHQARPCHSRGVGRCVEDG
jgi:hypothetical protein